MLTHPRNPKRAQRDLVVPPIFQAELARVPRDELPAGEMPPEVAYQIVHDELMLDGNARLNLATFVTHLHGPAGATSSWRRRSTRT